MPSGRFDLDRPLWHTLLLAASIGIFVLIAARFIDAPFVWRFDYPSAHNATNAVNHLRYGLEVTQGALVRNANPEVPEHLLISTHHPPMLSLTVAGAYAMVGVDESTARGVILVFSVVSVLLLYWSVRLLIGKTTALGAAAIFALLPLQIVYSTKVNFEPMLLTYVLGVLVAYGYWLRRPGVARFIPMALLFFLAASVDWGGYYIGGILPAFHFLNRLYHGERIQRSDYILWVLPVLGVAMFALFVGHLYWVDPKLVSGLWDLAAERSGVHDEYAYADEGFSNLSLVQRTITRSALHLTLPVLALGVTALLLALAKLAGSPRGARREEPYILLFWVLGLTHMLVFRHVYWVHEFLVHTLLVPVAVSTGWLLAQMPRVLAPRVTVAAVVVFALSFLPLSLLQTRQTFWDGQVAEILDLAKYLNQQIPEGSVVLTTASHHPFLHPAVPHYAERDVIDGVETWDRLQQWARRFTASPLYLMAYDGRSADPEATAGLIGRLDSEGFPAVQTPWGALYELPDGIGEADANGG